MNEYREQNKQFLLNVSDDVFDDWLQTISLDDVLYAKELLEEYLSECEVNDLEEIDVVDNITDAVTYLNKFKGVPNA